MVNYTRRWLTVMIKFVTSFSAEGYEQYAKNMLFSVIKHWKDDLQLIAYYHDMPQDIVNEFPVGRNIEYRNLNDVPDMLAYREAMKEHDGTGKGKVPYNWRLDAIKWCHKVYALTDTSLQITELEVKGGWLIWLDADTVTNRPLSEEKLKEFLNDKAEISHLGRTATDYSETSFVAFNLDYQAPHLLLADLRGCYDTGEVVSYREWHDGFIFERLLNIYSAHGMKVQNLSPEVKDLDAFGVSPLAYYMDHFKGNKKEDITKHGHSVYRDVNLPRFKQLAELVRTYVTDNILEIGTWNGGRAIEMSLAAFEKTDSLHYIGFDLFESATLKQLKKEFTTTAPFSLEQVQGRLQEFKDKMLEKGKTFTFELHRGDSKENLGAVMDTSYVTFAYIDGGHSDKTVNSDYKFLKDVPVLVFDDFYSKDINDNIIDEKEQAVNRLVMKKFEGKRITVLPSQDKVWVKKKQQGITHLAVLLNNDDLPPIPADLRKAPIIIQPKDSVPQEHITANIKANLELINDWSLINNCDINDESIIIVSGGDSTDFEAIKYYQDVLDSKIVCVKHSYPKLLEAGIQPYACVILDPREIKGTSTHGVVRASLFETVDDETMFFVASMTDPSVTKYLLDKTDKVYGWHAFSQSLKDNTKTAENPDGAIDLGEGATFVTGGTCAAMRAIGMFHILGFRDFELFGYDSNILDEVTDEMKKEKIRDKQPKYIPVELNDKNFWTTGELLAMAQDCEKLFESTDVEMNIVVHDDKKETLIGEAWRTSSKFDYHHYSHRIDDLKPTPYIEGDTKEC